VRLGRFEFGIILFHESNKRKYVFSYDNSDCGCRILEIWKFYFTWLGDECYNGYYNEEDWTQN
jgi:hypothetical protein